MDIDNGAINNSHIPSFFVNTYKAIGELEKNNELENPDAFNNFMTIYKSLVESQLDTLKEGDDSYGIFNS